MKPASSQSSSTTEDSRPVIFVVDDEQMLLELNALILAPMGYRIQTFNDPENAAKAFAAAEPKPVLIVTDYAMPNMNGMDLIAACRKLNPAQKILLVSGTVDESIYRNAPQRPNEFIAKPYQSRQLTDCVRRLLAA